MELGYLFTTLLKMVLLVAWIYGLLWGLARKQIWQKALTILLAFGVIQFAFLLQFGDYAVFSAFDQGLLLPGRHNDDGRPGPEPDLRVQRPVQSRPVGILRDRRLLRGGHHLRWVNGDATGVFVAGIGVVLAAMALIGVGRLLRLKRGIPVLSAFTFYLAAIVIVTINRCGRGQGPGRNGSRRVRHERTSGRTGLPCRRTDRLLPLCAHRGGVCR